LQAIVGLSAEDDDGNAASKPIPAEVKTTQPEVVPPKRKTNEELATEEQAELPGEFPEAAKNALTCSACQTIISQKVHDYSLDKHNKALCFDCQKGA